VTKREYIVKQKAVERHLNKRFISWFFVLVVGMLACVPLSSYIERHEELWWLDRTLIPVFGLLALGGLASGGWLALRHQRRDGLICRHCGKLIHSPQLAIATGNCGHCGESLFDDKTKV